MANSRNRAGGKLSWRPSFMRDISETWTEFNWVWVALCRYSYKNCKMFTSKPDWVGVLLSLFVTTWRRICFTVSIMSMKDKAWKEDRSYERQGLNRREEKLWKTRTEQKRREEKRREVMKDKVWTEEKRSYERQELNRREEKLWKTRPEQKRREVMKDKNWTEQMRSYEGQWKFDVNKTSPETKVIKGGAWKGQNRTAVTRDKTGQR